MIIDKELTKQEFALDAERYELGRLQTFRSDYIVG
jgi:hypothetical protein